MAYDLKKLDVSEREFAAQDKQWNAPKFFGLGLVTILIVVGLIFWASARAIGCTIAITP